MPALQDIPLAYADSGRQSMSRRVWIANGVAALVGLALGAAIGAAGKPSTKTVTIAGAVTTVHAGSTPARTVTRVVVHTHTVTQEAKEAAPTTQTSGAGGDPGPFSGNGSRSLGTITVPVASTLHWSCSSCEIFGVDGLSENGSSIAVDSEHHGSGETAVEPATYKEVKVIVDETESAGGWTIEITPG
jgi:hypothetical protein